MKVATAAQIRELERLTFERGTPSLTLMENAAAAVRDVITRTRKPGRAAILCGAGNNGGDGFAVARLLKAAGWQTVVYTFGDAAKYSDDTRINRERWDGEVRTVPDEDIARADCIVEAICGIGFRGSLEGDMKTAVEYANRRTGLNAPLRVAVDIPAGVQADTGRVEGVVFDAGITVTFTLPKPGLFLLPGALYCGHVLTANVGVPVELVAKLPSPFSTGDRMFADAVMPIRRKDAHKADFGRLLVVGGSADYPGAVCFTTNAAVRMGAGLVTCAVPRCLYPIVAPKFMEAMPRRMPQDKAGRFSPAALPALLTLQGVSQATVIGPGLGRSDALTELVAAYLRGGQCPAVVDADGIFALAAHMDVLRGLARPVVLTPHDGEFARMTGGNPPPAGGIERLETARAFARIYRCVLVLKGHRTITAAPDGRVIVNTSGNPGMAKGGSGDVLAGIIGALLCQGLEPFLAASVGVYLHGAVGDVCANGIGEYGMTPSDMIAALPQVTKKYNNRVW